jgi:ketosteroid isomerase-like protein
MEVDEFTPVTFAANEDAVFTIVRCRARSRATKKSVDMNLHHYFRFRGDKIFYYRGTEDSAQTEAALRP